VLQIPGTGSQLQDMACVMMQGMQQMAQQQHQMLQLMLSSGPSTSTAFNNIRMVTGRQPALPRQILGYRSVTFEEVATPPAKALPAAVPVASPKDLPPQPEPEELPLTVAVRPPQPEPEELPLTVAVRAENPSPSVLMDMLDAREAEKKQAKEEAKKEAKEEAKKAGKIEAETPSKTDAAPAKKPRVMMKRPAASDCGKPFCAAGVAQTTPEKTRKPSHKPTYCIERSRSRIQCRSGKRGAGQNFSIKFGANAERKTVEDAKKKAEAWRRSQLRMIGEVA